MTFLIVLLAVCILFAWIAAIAGLFAWAEASNRLGPLVAAIVLFILGFTFLIWLGVTNRKEAFENCTEAGGVVMQRGTEQVWNGKFFVDRPVVVCVVPPR